MRPPQRLSRCRRYCWADCLDDKNSALGKVILAYVLLSCSAAMALLFRSTARLRAVLEGSRRLGLAFLVDVLSLLARLDFLLLALSYLRCYFGDPGYVRRAPPPAGPAHLRRVCPLCAHWKPPRAHHCSRCGRCVFKMERHCHFINNCVGARNLKSYAIFLAAFALFILVFMLAAPAGLAAAARRDPALARSPLFAAELLLCAGLSAQGCFFFAYVCELLAETGRNILHNRTAVERKQRTFGAVVRKTRAFAKVFGDAFWLFPAPVFHRGRHNLLEEVYTQRAGADLELPALSDAAQYGL